MINKIIIDDSNITLNESTAFPFTYTFSKSGIHKVRIGLENTDEICAYAFKDCNDLTKVEFPSIITKIKRNAFENCSSLKKIYIPSTIEYVGPNVFDGCDSLTEITFEADVPPTFHSTLSEFTTCYIPTDSKFIKVEDNSELVKDGSIDYYEKNFLGGYDAVDFEALEDEKEYYFDNWVSVHDHLNTIEEKNRVKPTNIGFYDGDYSISDYGQVGSASSYNLFDIYNIKLTPENCTNKHYTLFSNNPELVNIDNEGNITTASNMGGRATLYAYTEPDYAGNYASASISIRVVNNQNIPKVDVPLSFEIDGAEITELTITEEDAVLPTLKNDTNADVQYSSSNRSVATIDEEGHITIKANGTTTITASVQETATTKAGSVQFELIVNIESEEQIYTITFKDGDNVVSTISGISGTDVSTPDITKEGYKLYGWSLDGENVTMPVDGIGDADITYYAIWEKVEPSIVTEYEGSGDIQLYNVDNEQSITTEYEGSGDIQLYNVDQSITSEYEGSGDTQLYNTNND